MLASTSHPTPAAPFNALTDTLIQPPGHKLLLPGYVNSFRIIPRIKPVNPPLLRDGDVTAKNIFLSPKIFPITFSYLQKQYDTKVLKVVYRPDEIIYKVALRSQLNSGSSICWLQWCRQAWTILLGHSLDDRLIAAITLAIMSRESHV